MMSSENMPSGKRSTSDIIDDALATDAALPDERRKPDTAMIVAESAMDDIIDGNVDISSLPAAEAETYMRVIDQRMAKLRAIKDQLAVRKLQGEVTDADVESGDQRAAS